MRLEPKKLIGYFFLGLLIWVSLVSRTWAASDTVTAIEVEGNTKTEETTILTTIKTRVGSSYSRETIHQDLKRLYGTGYFTDIQIDKETAADGGIKIVIRVKEKPVIGRVVIQGAKEVSESKVRDEIAVKQGQVLDEKKIAQSKEKIKDLYSKEGLGLAVVGSEIKETGKNEAEVVFRITENKGLRVEKISFEGNTVFSARKLRRFMKTKEHGILSFITGSGKYREEVVERDVAFLTYQYLNRGYLKAQVQQPEIVPMPNGKGIELKFKIQEGERYKIRNVDLAGEVITTREEILSKFDTLKGNYYSQQLLENDLQRVNDLYGNMGYAFANVRPQFFPDDATHEVDIKLNIEKGDRITIERINISGNTITRDKVIRRELKIAENSIYNEALVKKSKERLEALGYFETVEFSTPKGSSEDKLILNINVKEKPTGSFSVGAGYSSSESFLFTASISKQNFMGLGISASLLAEVSKKRQQFSLQYFDPYFLDTQWILNGNVQKLLTRYDDFDRDSLGGELSIGRHFFDNWSLTVGYHIEQVDVGRFSVLVPDFFRQNTKGLTSSGLFSIERDTRNNRLFATKGSFNQVGVEYAGLGGNNHFFRVNANSRWFFPIPFPKNSVIKANARLGYIQSLNNQPVPLFERYFTGGINSLRGFRPRSIGPSLQIPPSTTAGDQTFVYGGDKMLVFNLEYEFPIYEAAGFRGVIFADAGNAFAEDQNLNPLKLRSNYGFGLRWISPFGPLRFEWGLPFKRKPGEDKIVFNFTIGSFF